MATWAKIALAAIQELGAKSADDELDDTEEGVVLTRLRWMLDSWVYSALIVPGYETVTLDITGTSARSYSLGPGLEISADLVPLRLESITYRRSGSLDYRPIDEFDLQTFEYRQSAISTGPSGFYYEVEGPIGRVHFDASPIINDSFQIKWHRFFLPATGLIADDEAIIPVGYERLIFMSLAMEMANTYGINSDTRRDLDKRTTKLRTQIFSANRRPNRRMIDSMFLSVGFFSRLTNRRYY